jgi:hypothetical protein
MTSDSKDSTAVTQLTSTNYGIWKNRVITAIGSKSAEAALVLMGTINPPLPDAKKEELIAWSRQDFIAMNIIKRSLSDSVLQSLEHFNNAHSLWNALKERYETIDRGQLLSMQREFLLLKQGKSTFEKFLEEILSMQAKIAATGHPLTDDQVLQTLIYGLNPSFALWIPTLASNLAEASNQGMKGPSIFNKLIGTIRNAEHSMNSAKSTQSGVSSSSETALAGQHQHQHSRPHCTFCTRQGHTAETCFNNPTSPSYKGSAEKAKAEAMRLYQQRQAKRGKRSKSAKGNGSSHTDPGDKGMVVATAMLSMLSCPKWMADSGASAHMDPDRPDFIEYKEVTEPTYVTVGGGAQLPVLGSGPVNLPAIIDGKVVNRRLEDVLHVPDLGFHLFSIESAISRGFLPVYKDGGFKIMDEETNTVMLDSVKVGKARYLLLKEPGVGLVTTKPVTPLYQLWHQRLGHVSEKAVKLTLELSPHLQHASPVNGDPCNSCQAAGQVRHSFKSRNGNKALESLAIVHTDVVGPLPPSLSGKRYFVTFTDDKSGYVETYPMEAKSEVNAHFQAFLPKAERASGKLLKILRSDGGGEYINGEMKAFLSSKGIQHQVTMPHTPQQNGVAERLNRTLMEMARSLLHTSSAPPSFWAEALDLVVWIHNRVPRGKKVSPYQLWFKHAPDLSALRTFGCLANAVNANQKKKLADRSYPLVFIGFGEGRKGWKFYNQTTSKVVYSVDVVFSESVFPFKEGSSPREGAVDIARLTPFIQQRSVEVSDSEEEEDNTVPDVHSDVSSELSDPPSDDDIFTDANENSTRPQRATHLPSRLTDYRLGVALAHAFVSAQLDIKEDNVPLTLEQAKALASWPYWKEAVHVEESNHINNGTWVLTGLPAGRTAIGNRWVFSLKFLPDGSIDKYKARLVAKGYSQKEGVDYKETFSPVVRSGTIRFVLAIAAMNDWPIHQADVIAAYLNGNLTEEIYMVQPPGLDDGSGRVCKLIKGLYGLKQSGRVWYQSADDQLKKMGFRCVESDQGLYVKGGLDVPLEAVVCLYVDDMIITAKSLELVQQIKADFHKQFKIVDSGEISFILGLQVNRDGQYLKLSQEAYIKKMSHRYGLGNSAAVSTPLPANFNMVEADKAAPLPPSLKSVYQSMIGAVMYAAMGTRIDVAFTAQFLSRKLQTPTALHFLYAKHLVRYLNSTSSYCLKFPIGISQPSNGQLVLYCDADYAGDKETARSTSGILALFNDALITWMSQLQNCVATSTLYSEYIAICEAAKEAVWLRRLLLEFGLSSSNATVIHADNQGANAFTKDTQFHRRTKHIDVRYHYTRDQIKDGSIQVEYVATANQKADILTKPLLNVKHQSAVKQLQLSDEVTIEREC